VTIEHASLYEKLIAGLKAECLSAKNSSERDRIREQFKKKEFNYLFVVDIFNEGVIFLKLTQFCLRPTESLTVFFFNN
jgi:superfamily II DNA or RNA helicase